MTMELCIAYVYNLDPGATLHVLCLEPYTEPDTPIQTYEGGVVVLMAW